MKIRHKAFMTLVALIVMAVPLVATADIASNCTITPNSATELSGSVPPQPGVEIYVYATTQTNVEYTVECDVTEQPASVVVLPADMESVTYNEGTGKLTIKFTNTDYLEGSNVQLPPGASTTFSIAIIPADPAGSGIPAEMRGSWMATNIPPFGLDVSGAGGWELIPPDLETPYFGYRLNGPDGSTGFFKMFIPDSMKELLEDLINLESPTPVSLQWSDLAVFNDNQQASMSITEQAGGALVSILVTFTEGATEIPDNQQPNFHKMLAQGAGVDKNITVGKAKPLSLTASNVTPVRASQVTLYGWVQSCQPGEKVKLTSANAFKNAKAKGGKALTRYNKKGWKQVTVQNDCSYSHSYKVKKNDVFQTILKRKGEKALKSNKLKIRTKKK